MDVLIVDIPESGLTVQATQKDAWLFDAIAEAVGDSFSKDDDINLTLKFSRYEDNVNVDGDVEFTTHRNCDRCLCDFTVLQVVPLKSVLIPKFVSKRDEREAMGEGLDDDMIDGEVEFGTYEGDRIDVSDLVRDAVVLALPMKFLCKETCKGLCQKCGQDLNQGKCACDEKGLDPRWKALEGLKIGTKSAKKGDTPKAKSANKRKIVKSPVPAKKALKVKSKTSKAKAVVKKSKKAR